MKTNLLYIALFLAAYFGFRFWRTKRILTKEKNAKYPSGKKLNKQFDWDAEEVEFEEIKDHQK